MSHINKTVSFKAILAKIARTFKPPDSSWIRESVEDIGWAIQAIGYHTNFIDKETEYPYIKMNNNRAIIPCDVERIKHVEYLFPVNVNGHILNPDGTTPFPQPDPNVICHPNYRGVRLREGSSTINPGNSTTQAKPGAPFYKINGSYIATSFQEGLIKLHYVGFNTDKDGLPLIIDDFDYKSCIEFYVVSQMILKGFKHPVMDYSTAFTQYETYRLRAENAVKALGLDSAERLQASFARYASGINFGQDFYMGLEQPEYVDRA